MLVDCCHLSRVAENASIISAMVHTHDDCQDTYERCTVTGPGKPTPDIAQLCATLGIMLHSLEVDWDKFVHLHTCRKIAESVIEDLRPSGLNNKAWQLSIVCRAVATSRCVAVSSDYPSDGPDVVRCRRCLWSGLSKEIVVLNEREYCPSCGREAFIESTENVVQLTEKLRQEQDKGKGS